MGRSLKKNSFLIFPLLRYLSSVLGLPVAKPANDQAQEIMTQTQVISFGKFYKLNILFMPTSNLMANAIFIDLFFNMPLVHALN